ncbi:hypothetical protein [Vibrio parahaemolyticus]|uniref:hypothetical protein n=1 Tax=Vibrio parahaemolyticus TaxID=670 RepID=UPI00084B2204|nr:hypothetical protein [Vibrio parahaemolyticus]EGQ9275262.1 hypothetical protein [Vibrio parahaemolyticus]EGQ9712230.1 hypothetical protein [Vibrio parahaemolyticus]EGQ9799031.1 hypothetical protein [Vibrio parahaemolyticus]EIA0904567.1 hypothetical protein [Vibrio parahaemolyticus]EID0733701.1 hypothetical protein [Vibrio parahaemolyticus]
MVEAYIVLDESGAKGKSNKNEQSEGEFGVVAGFLCSVDGYKYFEEVARDISQKTTFCGGKLHITDIPKEKSDEIRDSFFNFMKRFGVCWSYSAGYVNGFYEFNRSEKRPMLLHSALVVQLLTKLLLHVKSKYPNQPIKLNIVTDLLQEATVKLIRQEFDEITELFIHGKRSRSIRRFNKIERKLEHATSTLEIDKNVYENVYIPELDYEIKCEVSDITFMADVLSNSVYRHLREKLKSTTPVDFKLESKVAISTHSLEYTCFGASDDDTMSFSDSAFSHRGKR